MKFQKTRKTSPVAKISAINKHFQVAIKQAVECKS